MDNQRLLVWAAFGFLAFMTWQAWQQDYGQKPQPATQQQPDTAGPVEPVQDDGLPSLSETTSDTMIPGT